MFLNVYLFFINTIFISFCFKYIRFIELNNGLDKINELHNKSLKLKKNRGKSLKSQLSYIKINDKIDDYEFKTFHWKVVIFVVAIIMAFQILRTEPLVIFGIQLKYSILLLVILLNWIFSYFIAKLGVRY